MKLKLLVALLSTGIAILVGCSAVIATLAPASTAGRTHSRNGALPLGWLDSGSKSFGQASSSPRSVTTTVAPSTSVTCNNSGTTEAPPSGTPPNSTPPSTAFVLVTITYAVKNGDSVASIARWFGQHGYGVQFAANLLVIESNQNLLVPGAIISISNGVMTIHSPV